MSLIEPLSCFKKWDKFLHIDTQNLKKMLRENDTDTHLYHISTPTHLPGEGLKSTEII